MSITSIPTKTDGSLGRIKQDRTPPLDLDYDLPASEYEELKTELINVIEEVGLSDGSTSNSLNEKVMALESGIADIDALDTRLTTLEDTTIPALDTAVDALDTRLTTLEDTTIPALDTRVVDLETTVPEIQASIVSDKFIFQCANLYAGIARIGGTANINATCYSGLKTLIMVGNSGEIQRSTNCGTSWTQQTPAGSYSGNFLVALSGSSAFKIIIAGQNGEIQTSSDDGVTWTKQTAPGSYTGTYVDGFMTNGGIAVLIGTGGVIHRSTNHGSTWSAVTNPDASEEPISITNLNTGTQMIIRTAGPVGFALTSTNSGATWTKDPDDVAGGHPTKGQALATTSAGTICIAQDGSDNISLRPTAGGNWLEVELDSGITLHSVCCPIWGSTLQDFAVAVGENSSADPVIYVTHNGGFNWTELAYFPQTLPAFSINYNPYAGGFFCAGETNTVSFSLLNPNIQ